MKSGKSTASPESWVVDYSAARARAIKRLGDRYLLARPINASRNDRPLVPLPSVPEPQ